MIDFHCHILPGIDDGSANMEESLAMARIACDDGIRHAVATPHFTLSNFNHTGIVLDKVRELQEELDRAAIPLRIHPGSEVRFEGKANFYEHAGQQHFCYLDRGEKFLLLEQRWAEYDPDFPEVVQWLINRGTTPIIPHPERHRFFRSEPQLLIDNIEAGAWTQISVDSLLGNNSDEVREFAEWLVEHGYAHTIATDAHNVNRKPNLSLGYQWLQRHADEACNREIRRRMDEVLLAVTAPA